MAAATRHPSPSTHLWTDGYLHAFAAARQAVVVTFDRTFAKSAGARPLLLGSSRVVLRAADASVPGVTWSLR